MTAAPVVLIASVMASVILRVQSDAPPTPTLEDVLSRAASYVVRFERVIPRSWRDE
jgi:hypothetical protein